MYLRDYSWAAGGFYPIEAAEAERMIEKCMEGPAPKIEGVAKLTGAISPHAGWVYSGPTCGKVFRALAAYSKPSLAICFGAVHVHGVRKSAIVPDGEWRTPLGNIQIDTEASRIVMDALGDMVEVSRNPHEEEHSLEVILPFIKKCFPNIQIVPIMIPPDRNASLIGRKIGELFENRDDVISLGSTDMTHYGSRFGFSPAGSGEKAVKWVREVNDKKLIDLILAMRADDIVADAERNRSACGAGAISAATGASEKMGAKKGILIDYTTSYDVRPRDGADTFVGYAGIVFG